MDGIAVKTSGSWHIVLKQEEKNNMEECKMAEDFGMQNEMERLVFDCVQKTIVDEAVQLQADENKSFSGFWEIMSKEQRCDCLPNSMMAKASQKRAMSDFATMLRYLDLYGADICVEDYTAVVNWRREKALTNARAKGGEETTVYGTVARSLRDFNRIYPRYRTFVQKHCGVQLPEIWLPAPLGRNCCQHEVLRAFTDEVVVRAFYLLWRLLLLSGLALGGLLLLMSLFRTAEVVPARFGDVLDMEWYGVYGALEQGKDDGSITEQLKNTHSKRLMILQREFMEGYRMVYRHLECRYPDEDVFQLYVCSADLAHKTMAKPTELSEFMRRVLTACGCDERYWVMGLRAMNQEPDLDERGAEVREASASACRRAGASRLTNANGMEPLKVDAFIGHALPEGAYDWKAFIRSVDHWPQLAQELSRFVFDDLTTANPAFCPILLQPEMEVLDLSVGQMAMRFRAEDAIEVEMLITTMEAEDDIELILPANAEIVHMQVEHGNKEPAQAIIAPLHDEAWYAEQRAFAEAINLESLLLQKKK